MNRIALILCLIVLAGAPACSSTVRPKPAISSTASFDAGVRNSGFVRWFDLNSPDSAGVITENARARYNALIEVYGKKFTVPLKPDEGITAMPDEGGKKRFKIEAEALVKFGTMSRWRRSGVRP